MKQKQVAKITSHDKEEFTKVTFYPDLAKFKMTELTDDMIGLFMKRAYDIAGTTPGVKVFLNNTKIAFNSKTPFKDYWQGLKFKTDD